MHDGAMEKLKELEIEVVLGARVDMSHLASRKADHGVERVIRTTDGREFEAELVVSLPFAQTWVSLTLGSSSSAQVKSQILNSLHRCTPNPSTSTTAPSPSTASFRSPRSPGQTVTRARFKWWTRTSSLLAIQPTLLVRCRQDTPHGLSRVWRYEISRGWSRRRNRSSFVGRWISGSSSGRKPRCR